MQVLKYTPKAVEIFKPDEIRQWLNAADATLIPFLTSKPTTSPEPPHNGH